MKTVKVKNIILGESTPKICVPITGKTQTELLQEIQDIKTKRFDIVEWRIDNLQNLLDGDNAVNTLKSVRESLGDLPLLVTCRTKKEGGNIDISIDDYVVLNNKISKSGLADLIDVEIYTDDTAVSQIIATAHENGVFVVASNHDFDKTPDADEIVKRLCFMAEMGADIAKIALMPNTKADVLALLCATEKASRTVDIPLITMSMGRLGVLSRLCSEVFGSCLTFGAAKNASAPGQINVADLGTVLDIIHNSI